MIKKILFCLFFSILFSCFNKRSVTIDNQSDFITTTKRQYKFGVCTVDRLRLRSSNDIHSKTYKFLNKGDIVEIISLEDKIVNIDEISGNWYYVSINNITGWVFGYYLQLAEDYIEANTIYKNLTGSTIEIEDGTRKNIEDYINNNFYFISDTSIFRVKDIASQSYEKMNIPLDINSFIIDKFNNFWIIGGKNNEKNLYYLDISSSKLIFKNKDVVNISYLSEKNTLIFVTLESTNKQNIYTIKYLSNNEIKTITKLKFNSININNENYENIIEKDRGSLINIDFDTQKNLITFKTYEDQYNYIISLVDNSYIKTIYTRDNNVQLDNSKNLRVENQIDSIDKTKMNYSIIIHNAVNGISKTVYNSQKYPITFIKSPMNELLSVTLLDKNENSYKTEIKIFSIFDNLSYSINISNNVYYPYWNPNK